MTELGKYKYLEEMLKMKNKSTLENKITLKKQL